MNIEYSKLTNKKLKLLCKENQIKGYSSLKKQELIDVIVQFYIEKLLHIELDDDIDEAEIEELLKYANLWNPNKNCLSILMEMQSDWKNVEFCDTDSDDESSCEDSNMNKGITRTFESYFYEK